MSVEEPGTVVSARLKGHALRDEGAPHDEYGHRIQRGSLWYASVGGEGRALCECGVLSDVLPSAYQRRKWHQQHKELAAVSAQSWLDRAEQTWGTTGHVKLGIGLNGRRVIVDDAPLGEVCRIEEGPDADRWFGAAHPDDETRFEMSEEDFPSLDHAVMWVLRRTAPDVWRAERPVVWRVKRDTVVPEFVRWWVVDDDFTSLTLADAVSHADEAARAEYAGAAR